MEFILEYKKFFKEGDKVLIEYWYNHMVTPVKILEKVGRKYKVSHNIHESKIQNAPDELVKNSEIISIFRSTENHSQKD
jgi:hypothetical protein